MSSARTRPARALPRAAVAAVLALMVVAGVSVPRALVRGETAPDHLVISEVVTGGGSASDELIELYNPTTAALPLEGLELIYVTATGATISRRAIWELGAPMVGAGRHVLVANELGVYASIADAVYASGMAATGGSVALRIQGAATAIDAVGWGTAASTWLEGAVAPAPPAGSSLERLPGGAFGSVQDSDDNATDFAIRSLPGPQNAGSPPVPDGSPSPSVSPSPTLDPSPTPEASPTAEPTSAPSPVPPTSSPAPSGSPDPTVVDVAVARALPDGTQVTIDVVALTASTFTDGGGYVADATGGIAVIVTDGAFDRGFRLRLTGTLDDRFSQRTLRVDAADVLPLGTAPEPEPRAQATGAIGEAVEGQLVRVVGTIIGSASTLTSGVAFDLDDGSGPTRLVVGTATAIDTTAWEAGTAVDLVGVAGQRDSTGSGTSGYRVHPRDSADMLSMAAPPSATPAPSGEPTPAPSASAGPGVGVISIAAARDLPKNTRARIRGTVTLPAGIVDPATAVIQDATGAIVLRLGDEVGTLARGAALEVDGVRSTKSGMETLRVTTPPTARGSGGDPAARSVRTGDVGEAQEALLVTARGGIVATPRRASSGTVSFEIDDGTGPLRVVLGASLEADRTALAAGTWIEVRGVLGQDTTGSQPLRGYRIWPRDSADVFVVAAATDTDMASGTSTDPTRGAVGAGGTAPAGLDAVGGEADPGLRVGATLVSGPWPELAIGGLLWDGTRLVAVEEDGGEAVTAVLAGRRPPITLELTGLVAIGRETRLGLPVVRLGTTPGSVTVGTARPASPSTELKTSRGEPRWVALVGRLRGDEDRRTAVTSAGAVALDRRCDEAGAWPEGVVGVRGIAVARPLRVVVPCDGLVAAARVTRSATALQRSDRDGTATASLAGMSPGGEPAPERPFAPAALLILAAAVLVAGIALARRMLDSDDDPTEPSEAAGDPANVPASPPTLTLVQVPRERAP